MRYSSYAICLFLLCSCLHLSAQDKKPLSPPLTVKNQIGETTIEINYNAPSKRGRQIWGDLVPYGQVWRTGANSATKISIDKDLKINDQLLAAGTYSIFSIPDERVWIVIFNKVAEQWGHFKYDETQDALRVEVVPLDTEEELEQMAISLNQDVLSLAWDKLSLSLHLSE